MRTTFIAALTAVLVTVPLTVWATHAFTDVPDSHPHAQGIDYVQYTGIASGCTPSTYCPDDALTRAQMATFLYRQSGNGPVTPTVNADKLDGLDSRQFALADHAHEHEHDVPPPTNVEQVVVRGGPGVTECPEGTFVVGGGFLFSGQEQHEVTGSHPVSRVDGFNREGWYVGVNYNGSTGGVLAWAVCLRVK